MRRMLIALLISALIAPTALNAAKLTGTLAKIKKSGTMTIGYRTDSPPFSFVDDDGQPAGYAVDLCRRVATAVKEELDKPNLKIVYEPVTSEDRIKAVTSGKVDIECGSTSVTLSRHEKVDFTLMTFVTGGGLLSTKAAGIKSTNDLGEKTVAVIKNTTTEAALKSFLASSLIDANVRAVDGREQAMQLLEGGEVDAFASDQIVLIGQVLQAPDKAKYVISQDLFSYEPYALMVRRDDADFRLVANRALARIYRTEQIGRLYDKWFGRSGVKPSPILLAMYRVQALPE